MITSVQMSYLRGIREGGVDGLSRISILVGPIGCGKSTVLDAMLIAGSPATGEAIGQVVRRRSELWNGARWLFWRGARGNEKPRIDLTFEGGGKRDVSLEFHARPYTDGLENALLQRRSPGPYSQVTGGGADTVFAADNNYEQLSYATEGAPLVRLAEPAPGGLHSSLAEAYSQAVEDGRLSEIQETVAAVMPGLKHILNLVDAGQSVVHLVFTGHSVPVAVSGDGIQALVRLCFDLALPPGGTVLLEEPEAYQHPKAIYQSARAITAAARRGVQVVLATHSLELMDAILGELREEELDAPAFFSVHGLYLRDGELGQVRYDARDAREARGAIGEDLR